MRRLKMSTTWYYLLITLLAVFGAVTTTTRFQGVPLLQDEEFLFTGVTGQGPKRSHKTAECRLGDQLRELGSTWFADLGPPFGVMYCIKCECVRVQKKRRVVARVQCRNIKNECPEPSCPEPVLYPGRCCKICPGDINSPDIIEVQQPIQAQDEEEKSLRHYATLMTARTSELLKRDHISSGQTQISNVVATGRFTFHRKNLYFSFYVSDTAARPRLLQFVDVEGNILEEQILSSPGGIVNSIYQNITGKICGVWRRLPKDYRKLLKEERLFVTLLWGAKEQQEIVLSGVIGRYTALSTELFSSLLEPAEGTDSKMMLGSGGTAIVSTSSSSTPSIHVTLVFNGLFGSENDFDVPLNISLILAEKNQIIMQEIERVKNPSAELNIVEISSPVMAADLRLLTRGRLVVSISNKHKPESLRLIGSVITRVTCELFQSLLIPSLSEESNENGDLTKVQTTGLAWAFLNRESALVYHVQIDDLEQENSSLITLIDVTGKRRTELEDLTPAYKNGWANGTIEKLGPRVLEPLYMGDLLVNIATQSSESLVRGRLSAKPVADARDSPSPFLFKRQEVLLNNNSRATGMAWFTIDTECNMHYELDVVGLEEFSRPFQLYLEEVPLVAPGAPVSKRLLEEFSGNTLEGFVLGVPLAELLRLDSGVSYLVVCEKETRKRLLIATLQQIKVPLNCLPHFTDNDVPALSYLNTDNGESSLLERQSCFYEGQFYEEGAQWTSKNEPCVMCHCHQGNTKCDTTECPALNCPIKKAGPNSCCPTCAKISEETNWDPNKGCYLAGKFYPGGSTFNPYIPPNGFDSCVECICNATSLTIICMRKVCPVLTCNITEAIRPNKTACCKVCPTTRYKPNEDGVLQDEQAVDGSTNRRDNKGNVTYPGGCYIMSRSYENGQEWHPKPYIGSAFKCIYCQCKDGTVRCERKKCPRSVCNNTNRQSRSAENNGFKYSESMDECCTQKCNRRNRRHHNHRRVPRRNS